MKTELLFQGAVRYVSCGKNRGIRHVFPGCAVHSLVKWDLNIRTMKYNENIATEEKQNESMKETMLY
jgi:hypothetical protein